MRRDLTNGDMEKRQLATVIYLIDNFSLRAGNEKDEDEAETFGACSLLIEHATLREGNVVSLHFLGKDSMVFQQDLPVSPQVYKNFKIFRKSKTGLKGPKDEIFDWVNVSRLMLSPRSPSSSTVDNLLALSLRCGSLGGDSDHETQQAPWQIYERSFGQSFPHLQCFGYFPGSAQQH